MRSQKMHLSKFAQEPFHHLSLCKSAAAVIELFTPFLHDGDGSFDLCGDVVQFF